IEDLADSFGLGLGVDSGRRSHVLQGKAKRLEEGHVLGVLASGIAADDDLAQLADVGPAQQSFFQRLLEIARFQAGLVLAVHHDGIAATQSRHVQLRFAKEVGTDRVDVGPLGEPLAVEDWLPAIGRGDDYVLALGGLLRPSHGDHLRLARIAHLGREAAAMFLVGTENLNAANASNLADGQQLRAGLLAAAEQADLARRRPWWPWAGP